MPTCTHCGGFFTSSKSWEKYCRACFRLRMEQKPCERCDRLFWGEDWKNLCPGCYRESKARAEFEAKSEKEYLRERVRWLEDELSKKGNAVPSGRIRELLMLSHPDKHHGSPLAHETTVWLLAMREQERRAT